MEVRTCPLLAEPRSFALRAPCACRGSREVRADECLSMGRLFTPTRVLGTHYGPLGFGATRPNDVVVVMGGGIS